MNERQRSIYDVRNFKMEKLGDFLTFAGTLTLVNIGVRIVCVLVKHMWTHKPFTTSENINVFSLRSFCAAHKPLLYNASLSTALILTYVISAFLNKPKESSILLPLLLVLSVIIVATHRFCKLFILKKTMFEESTFLLTDMFNVGRSSAISYVENYLANIIPALPTGIKNHKGLAARIRDFDLKRSIKKTDEGMPEIPEDDFQEDTVKCLFVLIPKSGNIANYASLSDADANIEYVDDLPIVNLDLLGHIKRDYKNPVHCFKNDKRKVKRNFVAEFATPLSSLYKMKSPDVLIPNQIEVFYEALGQCLNEKNYGCLVQLIYYDDDDSKGNTISKVLWDAINHFECKR